MDQFDGDRLRSSIIGARRDTERKRAVELAAAMYAFLTAGPPTSEICVNSRKRLEKICRNGWRAEEKENMNELAI
jgi:hypothetical protein